MLPSSLYAMTYSRRSAYYGAPFLSRGKLIRIPSRTPRLLNRRTRVAHRCPPGSNSWRLPAAGDGAAGHDADQVGAVFGAGVDVGVEVGVGDRDVLDRIRGE